MSRRAASLAVPPPANTIRTLFSTTFSGGWPGNPVIEMQERRVFADGSLVTPPRTSGGGLSGTRAVRLLMMTFRKVPTGGGSTRLSTLCSACCLAPR